MFSDDRYQTDNLAKKINQFVGNVAVKQKKNLLEYFGLNLAENKQKLFETNDDKNSWK